MGVFFLLQIISKYIEDPVLLERDDVGPVKFDLRFVVMLKSVDPLELAVHQKFIVRVANKYNDYIYRFEMFFISEILFHVMCCNIV